MGIDRGDDDREKRDNGRNNNSWGDNSPSPDSSRSTEIESYETTTPQRSNTPNRSRSSGGMSDMPDLKDMLEEVDLGGSDSSSSRSSGGSGGSDRYDVERMSKKELAKKVIEKEGQINAGNNQTFIKCPCSKSTFFNDYTSNYMCKLVMRPDPKDGKQKPVCSGPIIGRKVHRDSGKLYKWKGGKEPQSDCPYTPERFGSNDR